MFFARSRLRNVRNKIVLFIIGYRDTSATYIVESCVKHIFSLVILQVRKQPSDAIDLNHFFLFPLYKRHLYLQVLKDCEEIYFFSCSLRITKDIINLDAVQGVKVGERYI